MKTKRSKRIGKKSLVLGVVFTLAFSMFAGAAIVDYLSNEVTETVTVESPFEVQWKNHPSTSWDGTGVISDNGLWTAGSTGTFWIRAENFANNDIDGTARLTLTQWDGISDILGEEIDSMHVTITNEETGNTIHDFTVDTSFMTRGDTNGNPGYDHLYIEWPFDDFPAETAYIAEVTFAADAHLHGDYTVSFQIV